MRCSAVAAVVAVLGPGAFVPLRQFRSPPNGGNNRDKWTSGLWHSVLADFNIRGVQLGVIELNAIDSTAPLGTSEPDPLNFSETIITGPATTLGDPRLPPECARLPGQRLRRHPAVAE